MKHLVVCSHKLFRQTPRGLQTTGGFTIQMDALADWFEQVTLCVPIVEDMEFQGASINATNINFHQLPAFRGRIDFIKSSPRIRQEMLSILQNADFALIILPSYLGTLAGVGCQRRHFPLFYWIVGNPEQSVVSHKNNPLAYWFADHITKHVSTYLIKRLTRDVLTFYNGRIFYDQGKPYHYTRISSSIHTEDIYIRDTSTPQNLAPNLLFVGRLSPDKGLSELLEAFAQLRHEFNQARLHIVGSGPEENFLYQQVQDLPIAGKVTFHGFVPQGEPLRKIYRQSDILIGPSLQDQTPKVILEGMAQSLPVVSTDVGEIPSLIQDGLNGLLISPGHPFEIERACKQILTDNELRQRLVSEGLKFARDHTVESETESMMKLVDAHFN